MTGPSFEMTPEALAGFEQAALRVLARRHPEIRWQALRDDPDPSGERRAASRDDDVLEDAA